MGLVSVAFWGVTFLLFMFRDITSDAFEQNPYAGIVIYMLLPALFWLSVAFSVVGMFFKWRRIKKHPEEAAPTHKPKPIAKRTAAIAIIATFLWLIFSGFASYKSYHSTSTDQFCGTACHIMKPEYTAFKHSQHDLVGCVQCHIGTEMTSAFEAKTNGIRQVWLMATKGYHTPIKTPLDRLRPDKSTCGNCHHPDRMRGEVSRTFTHFSKDADNTPVRYKLLFNITTGAGVHWHVGAEHKVQYYAADPGLQDIPFIRHTRADGTVSEFMTAKFDRATLDESKLRTMNCADCHNRAGHPFKSPTRAVSDAMEHGGVPTSLPFLAREAIKAFSETYATTAEAEQKINAAVDAFYTANPLPPDKAALLPQAKEGLVKAYRENFFPELGVDARAFNDNLGHFEFKGCERCHDAKHETVDKTRKIERKCDTCHTLISQSFDADEMKKAVIAATTFKHPDDPVSLSKSCSSCHALKKE
ncbi:MAG TPA: NapC/NirT family cytochrome c [Planctomycetota bacterium]|nr:NapC/NirT family cytochrome c [Planctomycetota bacterium]